MNLSGVVLIPASTPQISKEFYKMVLVQKGRGFHLGFLPIIVRFLARYLSDVCLYYRGASRRFSWTVSQEKREIAHFSAHTSVRTLLAVWTLSL